MKNIIFPCEIINFHIYNETQTTMLLMIMMMFNDDDDLILPERELLQSPTIPSGKHSTPLKSVTQRSPNHTCFFTVDEYFDHLHYFYYFFNSYNFQNYIVKNETKPAIK